MPGGYAYYRVNSVDPSKRIYRHHPALYSSVMPEKTILLVDDGDGIAAEHLSYIFDRLYRADPSHSREFGGPGLGLAIAEAIVEAHGGRITAVSKAVGMETAVRRELP